MPSKQSAGIVLVRQRAEQPVEVLLVHPGGPLWASKDLGAWSIPKGEHGPDEDPLATAIREFREELGADCPVEALIPIGEVVQRAGKLVRAWCTVGDLDPAHVVSNTFEMTWPPRSGRRQTFPEVDRAEWFPLEEALRRVLPAQAPLLERAVRALVGRGDLSG